MLNSSTGDAFCMILYSKGLGVQQLLPLFARECNIFTKVLQWGQNMNKYVWWYLGNGKWLLPLRHSAFFPIAARLITICQQHHSSGCVYNFIYLFFLQFAHIEGKWEKNQYIRWIHWLRIRRPLCCISRLHETCWNQELNFLVVVVAEMF